MNIGDFGHIFTILAFVAALIAVLGYYRATQSNDLDQDQWLSFARKAFYIHSLAVLGVIATLFYIIYNHQYQYHYAWAHSSNDLPVHFMISCFWEGQEGSFLLWIFWHVVLGNILLRSSAKWEAPVMSVFSSVQVFLASMILGVYISGFKLGSSPFVMLRDVFPDAPVFSNPDFIPKDGNGLNPLLQNYWMVIHPPTLFLGFALVTAPFCFVIAGLWKENYSEWIKPALPWSLAAGGVLGLGIIMGGYWAYETLNFGGYWNWDPVENASLVPWVIVSASIHGMISYKNTKSSLKSSMILTAAGFLLILYSTFLTRSGILGNASVHSFTDLGMSGQLLIYLLAYVVLTIFLLYASWKYIPTLKKESATMSREFWMFIGITILCLASFQILVTTSLPVINAIVENFGVQSKLAPPADLIGHYNKWHLWSAVIIAILTGVAQFIWWGKMDAKKLSKVLFKPFLLAVLISIPCILFLKISKPGYVLLLVSGLFSLFANFMIMFKILKGNIKMAGGALAHLGLAMILIGILFSSGYSKVVSFNTLNKDIFSASEMDEKAKEIANRENVLLRIDETVTMGNYVVTYKGLRFEVNGFPEYIKREMLLDTPIPDRKIARQDIILDGTVYFKKGDAVNIVPENSFYEVKMQSSGDSFTLYPRAQINPKMGLIASPDTRRFLTKDVYIHVSSIPDYTTQEKWKLLRYTELALEDTFITDKFVFVLESLDKNPELNGISLGEKDLAVGAVLKVHSKTHKPITLKPVYILKDRQIKQQDDTSESMGLKVSFKQINPEQKTLSFEISTRPPFRDYIILKAIEKPMINLLWIGTVVLVAGFMIAMKRRYSEWKGYR